MATSDRGLAAWIARGRERKVHAILAVIPVGATAERVRLIADGHARMDRAARIKVATEAGVREPSDETWAAVVDALRSREPDPFAAADVADVVAFVRDPIAKTCGCGARYTRAEWEALTIVGNYADEVEKLEMRQCTACASTLAIVVETYAGNDTKEDDQ